MSFIEPTKREIKMEYCFANDIETGMEHILIPEGISDKLKGKTIEKTWHFDGRDYYKGYFDLWKDLDCLSERICSNDDIFDTFVKEWKTLKYGFRFNTES